MLACFLSQVFWWGGVILGISEQAWIWILAGGILSLFTNHLSDREDEEEDKKEARKPSTRFNPVHVLLGVIRIAILIFMALELYRNPREGYSLLLLALVSSVLAALDWGIG